MATLTTWTFSKRHNSTKVPTGGTDHDVQLKGGCDILTPTFLLNYTGIPTFNYMLFAGRYYFVTGIKSVRNDLVEVSGKVDVLATFKSAVKASSPYVLYYTHNNTEIADKRLSVKATKTIASNQGTFDALGTFNPNDPTIVLMVNGVSTVGSYAIHQSDLGLIFTNINANMILQRTNINWPFIQSGIDWMDKLSRWLDCFAEYMVSLFGQLIYSGKAIDNIRSAHLLPLSMSDVGGASARIYLGSFDSGVDALKVTDQLFTDSASVTIPWPAGITDWRRLAPYTEMYLYIPYIGLTSVSVSDIIGETTLTVYMSLDKFSGDAIFQVKTGSGNVIGHYTTNLRSDFPIGASNVSGAKQTGSLVSSAIGAATAVAGIATGGSGAVIVGGAAAAGLGLVNSVEGTPTSIGGATGGAVMGLTADKAKITMYSIFHDTVVTPSSVSAEKGTPYNGVLSLSTTGLSGYFQTSGASVEGSMTDTERQEINALMDGGFYLE